MAHYDITYTCGHEETIELFGKVSERERRIEWLESQPCVECARKESIDQAQSRLDACIEEIKAKDDDAWQSVQKIIEAAETQLDGSLKQVSWASEIRLDCMSQLVGRVRLAVIPCQLPREPSRDRLHRRRKHQGGMVDRQPALHRRRRHARSAQSRRTGTRPVRAGRRSAMTGIQPERDTPDLTITQY